MSGSLNLINSFGQSVPCGEARKGIMLQGALLRDWVQYLFHDVQLAHAVRSHELLRSLEHDATNVLCKGHSERRKLLCAQVSMVSAAAVFFGAM